MLTRNRRGNPWLQILVPTSSTFSICKFRKRAIKMTHENRFYKTFPLPPFAEITDPVTQPARSLTRRPVTFAASSGVPIR